MSTVRLGLVQFPRGEGVEENVEAMVELISEAGADVKLLPENWASQRVLGYREHEGIVKRLAEELKEGEVLVAGAHYVERGEEVVSVATVLTAKSVEATFEKRHPSRAIGERGWLKPGRGGAVFKARGVLMGGLVCIDLMYPEEVRKLALKGASVVLNPASISMDRSELWRCIGRCRAAENTVFVASANNTLTTYPDGRPVMGGSFIASPEGSLVLSVDIEPGLYVADLDLSWIDRVRAKWGLLEEVRGGRQAELNVSRLSNT
ncbi:MAG: carbon-nitrogen hydrolase family protein [Candidatus Nezhaarchaeota archaeon]|nr:carbon-nitrogen hydrolase family protein [Candidatus Nezhaarchaeota archaeon]